MKTIRNLILKSVLFLTAFTVLNLVPLALVLDQIPAEVVTGYQDDEQKQPTPAQLAIYMVMRIAGKLSRGMGNANN